MSSPAKSVCRSSNDAKNKSPEDLKAEGFSQLSSGKRHLLVSDVPEAVSSLAMACHLLSKQFGESHYECAEAYYYYGKSLLEMSRLESGVLGNALDGVPEDGGDADNSSRVEDPEKMTSEEKAMVETKVKEALEFNYQTCEIEEVKAVEEAAAAKEDYMEGGDEEVSADKSNAMEEDDSEGRIDENEEPAAEDSTMDDEEPSNLQLSWEMLEMAKVVYTNHLPCSTGENKAEMENKICTIYLLLGEVSLENENYQQAVDDLTICLSRRQSSLPSDSRSIAETHYQLGIALAFNDKYEEAENNMKSAIDVLEMRVLNLQKMESSDNLNLEILELQDLIKDIKEKVADHNSMKAEVAKKIKEGFSSSSGKSDMSSKNVSNIGIKRKDEMSKVVTNSVSADTAAGAM